jgi:hypothetical protein
MTPCGKCNPCIQAIKEGLGWRIPVRSRINGVFNKQFVKPIKKAIKKIIPKKNNL